MRIDNHQTANRIILLAALFVLFVSACSQVQSLSPVTVQPQATATWPRTETEQNRTAVVTSAITPTFPPKPSVSQTASPDKEQRKFPDYMRIAILVWGEKTETALNGRALVVDLNGNILDDIDLDCAACDSLSWSPDGQSLAYAGSKGESSADLFTVQLTNGAIKRIINTDPFITHNTWSPDGKSITYVAQYITRPFVSDIINIDLATGELQKLTDNPELEAHPAWSPDGKKIAYIKIPITKYDGISTWSDPGELWVMDGNGKNQVKLAESLNAWSSGISWSPDGKKIAYSDKPHCGNISIVDIETLRITKTTEPPLCANYPVWSPDGKSIAFIGMIYDPPNTVWVKQWGVYLIDATGQNLSQILAGSEKVIPESLTWAPVPGLEQGHTYVVTALGSGLRIRESAKLNAKVIERLESGDRVRTEAGPEYAMGFYWWQVVSDEGLQGWIAEFPGWLLFEK